MTRSPGVVEGQGTSGRRKPTSYYEGQVQRPRGNHSTVSCFISSPENTELRWSLPTHSVGHWFYKLLIDVILFRFLRKISLPNTELSKFKTSGAFKRFNLHFSTIRNANMHRIPNLFYCDSFFNFFHDTTITLARWKIDH